MGYTDPLTGKPSFDGNVAFIVTSGTPLPNYSTFNLSAIPTSTPSPAWQAVAAAWRANQVGSFQPVESISAAVCSPKYSIEPWIVDFVNGSMKLVQLQSKSVGNLDPTQLKIAIQDCLGGLTLSPPISVPYGVSIAQLLMLFTLPPDNSSFAIPYSPEKLTSSMNAALLSSVQAYLDNFPFGNFTPPESKLLVPALVLSAEFKFICTMAALYFLLSGALFYLFKRLVAKPFTIRSVMGAINQPANTHSGSLGVSHGQAVAAMVEHIATTGNDPDEAATEARINKSIGDHYTMIHEDMVTHRPVLALDLHKHEITPNPLLDRFEHMRTRTSRFAWVSTPAFGAALVGFGVVTWRHPYVVSNSPKTTGFFFALFTWGLGLWRTLSLLAVNSLIRQANSDVSRLIEKFAIILADESASMCRNGAIYSNTMSNMAWTTDCERFSMKSQRTPCPFSIHFVWHASLRLVSYSKSVALQQCLVRFVLSWLKVL